MAVEGCAFFALTYFIDSGFFSRLLARLWAPPPGPARAATPEDEDVAAERVRVERAEVQGEQV